MTGEGPIKVRASAVACPSHSVEVRSWGKSPSQRERPSPRISTEGLQQFTGPTIQRHQRCGPPAAVKYLRRSSTQRNLE